MGVSSSRTLLFILLNYITRVLVVWYVLFSLNRKAILAMRDITKISSPHQTSTIHLYIVGESALSFGLFSSKNIADPSSILFHVDIQIK